MFGFFHFNLYDLWKKHLYTLSSNSSIDFNGSEQRNDIEYGKDSFKTRLKTIDDRGVFVSKGGLHIPHFIYKRDGELVYHICHKIMRPSLLLFLFLETLNFIRCKVLCLGYLLCLYHLQATSFLGFIRLISLFHI